VVEPGLVARFEGFCSRLRLEDGEPLRLAAFQRTMLGDFLAGCRETIACLPKGSGKTTTLGAVALYELLTDPGCEGRCVPRPATRRSCCSGS
jgi:hypothetical protein